MITTTGRQIISDALLTLGVLAQGEDVSAENGAYALKRLNSMIDSWGLQRQAMFQVERTTYQTVASTQTYTIGVGGAFNQARPIFIEGAAYLVPTTTGTNQTEIGIAVLTDLQYQAQSLKQWANSLPNSIYYNNANVGGLGTITILPIPTQVYTLVLYCPVPIAQFDLSTSVALTPGYERAIMYNLCRELYLAFGRPWSQDLNMLAVDSLLDLKRVNYQSNDLGFDIGLVARTGKYAYNINSDQP